MQQSKESMVAEVSRSKEEVLLLSKRVPREVTIHRKSKDNTTVAVT